MYVLKFNNKYNQIQIYRSMELSISKSWKHQNIQALDMKYLNLVRFIIN